MHCPDDANQLTLRETERYAGYVCDECRGVWLTLRHFHAIDYARNFSYEEFARALAGSPKVFTSLHCPSGCGKLVQANWLEEPLCWCPSCQGVWFNLRSIHALRRRRVPQSEPAGFIDAAPLIGEAGTWGLLAILSWLSC